MSTALTLLFASQRSPAAWLIRLATWSRWSHSAIMIDGIVYDATFLGGGVRATGYDTWAARYSRVLHVPIAVPDVAAAEQFLLAQLGKWYDWGAVLGFLFRRSWADSARWFCSELAEAALAAGGLVRFRADVSRVTPQHQWMLAT